MAYTKVNWQNGATALSAENFNHMDQGIADAHDDIAAAQNEIDNVNTNLSDNYFAKTDLYGNNLVNYYEIPKALSDSDRKASYNYTFPADGYLRLDSACDTYVNLLLTTLCLYGANNAGYMGLVPSPIPAYFRDFIFVKKGMSLKGDIRFPSVSTQQKFNALFYALELNQ